MSVALGKPTSGEMKLESSVLPELAGIFDAAERVVALISRPVYTRDTFLP